MVRRHGNATFSTETKQDNAEGWIGVHLVRDVGGTRTHVASVTFWDAMGQFSIVVTTEVPLTIVEEMITEARRLVPSA
jgi:hypothetical protein